MRRHKLWRSVQRVLTAMLVVGPAALVALWLTFQHRPGWYRPASLDDVGIQQARTHAVATADYVGDQMVRGQPFDVVLLDRSVNRWLAALPHAWPDARDFLPPELSDPAVWFDEGKVRIGAHYASGAWQAIVSIGLLLRVSDDGGTVEIALSDAHGGSLPVPRAVLKSLLDRVLQGACANRAVTVAQAESRAGGRSGSNSHTPPLTRHGGLHPRSLRDPPAKRAVVSQGRPIRLLSAMNEIQSGDQLFEGVRIRNRFVWFNGDRPFRIDLIEIDGDEFRLRIEPL